uniref:Uncharacterized protein n=1 Tax=Myotis myotis TaxID=51298 RepID=A0A7J7SC66_MYOMY|nr:hypothetical protein mMyoMyo1_009550 [Myotis myotis]
MDLRAPGRRAARLPQTPGECAEAGDNPAPAHPPCKRWSPGTHQPARSRCDHASSGPCTPSLPPSPPPEPPASLSSNLGVWQARASGHRALPGTQRRRRARKPFCPGRAARRAQQDAPGNGFPRAGDWLSV